MNLFLKIFKSENREQGFTLLELLMVIAILSAVAWMALGTVTNNSEQVRFEDTRNRLNAIRTAIIGDTSRTLNGQPEIRGYVADMGSLPPSLNALIYKNYCSNPQYPTEASCTGAGETWTVQGEHCTDGNYIDETSCTAAGETWMDGYYYQNDNYGLWTGWNGPYLNAAELMGYPKFRDGWGNEVLSGDDPNNFGWTYILDYPDSGALTVQSLGMDGVNDESGGGTGDYEADYPYGNPLNADSSDDPIPLVYQNEYRTLITDDGPTSGTGDGSGGLWIDFGTPHGCWACSDGTGTYTDRLTCEGAGYEWNPVYTANDLTACGLVTGGVWLLTATITPEYVCLRIANRVDGGITKLESVDPTYNSSADLEFAWNGTQQKIEFLFEDNTYLGQGQLAYKIFEYSSGACTDTAFPKGADDWELFTIVPGSAIPTLRWNVNEK